MNVTRGRYGSRKPSQDMIAAMSVVPDELGEVSLLFSGLDQRQLRQLARLAKERQFRPV